MSMKTTIRRISSRAAVASAGAILALASMVNADEPAAPAPAAEAKPAPAPDAKPVPAPPKEKVKKWETSAAAGLTLTRGNSDTLLVSVSLDTKRKWERSEVAFGISGGYGENNSVENTKFVTGFGDYHWLINERFYTGLHVDGNYDGIASLDYRIRISPLVGYYVIKTTNTSLNFEAGPALVMERYSHQPEENYWAARLGERFEQKITASTKLWQSLDYVARVDEWSDKYVVTGEIGIDTAITKKWSLRTLFQDIYDSRPAKDHKHNDLRLIAGTAYKF